MGAEGRFVKTGVNDEVSQHTEIPPLDIQEINFLLVIN